MVGRTDRVTLSFGDIEGPITFNLKSIDLLDSHKEPGLHLTDVVASVFCYALNHQDDNFCESLLTDYSEIISQRSIMPDFDYIDPTSEALMVNAALLLELVDATCRGHDISETLNFFVATVERLYPQHSDTLGTFDIPLLHKNVDVS